MPRDIIPSRLNEVGQFLLDQLRVFKETGKPPEERNVYELFAERHPKRKPRRFTPKPCHNRIKPRCVKCYRRKTKRVVLVKDNDTGLVYCTFCAAHRGGGGKGDDNGTT